MSEDSLNVRRRLLAVGLVLLGVAAMAGGGLAAAQELSRKPTAADLRTATARERVVRWRNLTAGEIFPAKVDYEPTGTYASKATHATARRLGIARPAGCDQAFDKTVAAIVAKYGCGTVTRATYVDATGSQVTTLGLLRVRDGNAADSIEAAVKDTHKRIGLRTFAPDGRVFGDAQRQGFSIVNDSGGYLMFQTSGWTDGRGRLAEQDTTETFTFAATVAATLYRTLTAKVAPCSARGVRC